MTDYEVQNFQEDVLVASRTKPVLVDFWAPWCGPCQVLGPVLERLAAEQSDAWTLVKVNTDQHLEVSMDYGIRGIPAVKLFVEGQVVDEFVGALPEYAVRQWLEKALPSEQKQQLARAAAALEAGALAEAEALLEGVLGTEPTNAEARTLLAARLVFRDPTRATALVEGAATDEPHLLQRSEAVQTLARLLTLDATQLPEEPGHDLYRDGIAAVQTQDFETALERFIALLPVHRAYDDDGARKACLALFILLGPEHPATLKYRRRFDMALY
jgi:putative thioredoxin